MRAGLSWLRIVRDLVRFVCLGLRSRTSLAAENLFLRKQLAFYQERKVKPRRADNPTRLTLVLLSHWFNWRDALTVVRLRTFITGMSLINTSSARIHRDFLKTRRHSRAAIRKQNAALTFKAECHSRERMKF